jgi:hypothetical protein
LYLINSAQIKAKLTASNGRAAQLAADERSPQEKIDELYLIAFSRKPRPDEMKKVVEYLNEPIVDSAGKAIDKKKAAQQNYQDLIWALMNTKEFLFNH